jgi:hypothetical protein
MNDISSKNLSKYLNRYRFRTLKYLIKSIDRDKDKITNYYEYSILRPIQKPIKNKRPELHFHSIISYIYASHPLYNIIYIQKHLMSPTIKLQCLCTLINILLPPPYIYTGMTYKDTCYYTI